MVIQIFRSDIMGTYFSATFQNNDAGTLLEILFWTLNFKYFAAKFGVATAKGVACISSNFLTDK